MTERAKQKLANLDNALKQLKSALEEPLDKKKLVIDATIQRFEFCYELLWKTLKVFLEQEGIEANTPKQIFQAAYQARWINHDALWSDMIKDRNTTSHVYNEKIAVEIYERVKKYFPEMQQVSIFLRNKQKR